MNLEDYMLSSLFAHFLVFVRMGAAAMYMPLVGEQLISTRVRLAFAVLMSLVATPLVDQYIPNQPASIAQAGLLIAAELFIGLMLGLFARIMVLTLSTAGQIIAFQTGLAAAQAFNPSLQTQGSVVGAILSLVGLMVIIAANLHHVFILAVVDSYVVFQPGLPLQFDDMSNFIAEAISRSFVIAVQMSAPFMVMGTVMYIALGVLSRLMPQIQVFFIALPIQIFLGLGLLFVTLPTAMLLFAQYFEDGIRQFMGS